MRIRYRATYRTEPVQRGAGEVMPDIRLRWPLTIQYKRCRNLACDYFGRSDCPMVTWLDDIFLPDVTRPNER